MKYNLFMPLPSPDIETNPKKTNPGASEEIAGNQNMFLGMEDGYRGLMMNRGARPGEEDEFLEPGVLECLGLTFEELRGKKVLDVCTGGGKTVEEAREAGIKMYGVDIAPAIDINKEKSSQIEDGNDFARRNVKKTQRELLKVTRQYPGGYRWCGRRRRSSF